MRPLGVTILAILAFLSGIWGIIRGLALLGIGGIAAVATGAAHPMAGMLLWGLAATFGVVALVVAVFYLGFAYGAWTLKTWAWKLGVWTAILSLVWALLVALGPGTMRGRFWEIVVNAGILYYLTTPAVRSAFGRG